MDWRGLFNLFPNKPWIIVILHPPLVGPGAYTITAVVVAGAIGYAYIKWKVRFCPFSLWM